MTEIYPNLHIGDEQDYEGRVQHEADWRIVHACKEPYHREALGYTGRGAPKNHPEYLIARRPNRLILNLVDVDDPAYVPKEIIDESLRFIHEGLHDGHPVLVHCNKGHSRSPTIGLLYLVAFTDRLPGDTLPEVEKEFQTMYPLYQPASGMRGFLVVYFSNYRTWSDGH